MIIHAVKTRVFNEGDNLLSFIIGYFKKIPEKSIIVITSKIVALAEGQTAVIESNQTKQKLILEESELAIPTKYVWLTIKDNSVMASAGIDESNSNGKLTLLPRNSFNSANLLRKQLKKKYGIKNLGILITDSRTVPLRLGTNGIAIGYAGFKGVKDYRGTPDIFGRKFKFSRANIADALASAAVCVMGEGSERQPLALIKEVAVEFCDRVNRKELYIDIQEDMYRPLFSKLPRYKKGRSRRPASRKKQLHFR